MRIRESATVATRSIFRKRNGRIIRSKDNWEIFDEEYGGASGFGY